MRRKGPRSKKGSAISQHYQHRIVEIGVKTQSLNGFSNSDSIASVLELNSIDDRILELRGDLIDEIHVLINTCLTSHQRRVMKLYLTGLTQNEIAEQVGASQSAVHKNLHGNLDYKNRLPSGEPNRYGGSVRKLEKYAKRSEKIQSILKRIDEIKKENNET